MSASRTIFLVMGDTDYEGSIPIRSFELEYDAKQFAKRCTDHQAKHRPCPPLEAPEGQWDKWYKQNANWEAKHPAKPYSDRSYSVMPLKLYGAVPLKIARKPI